MNTTVFVMAHKAFTPPEDPVYQPLQVGCAENEPLGDEYLRDDTGENISNLNHLFGELTGMYWVWQNYDGPEKYIGINHYRRYFTDGSGDFLDDQRITALMEDHDLIASERIPSEKNYKKTYQEAHNIDDLMTVRDSIEKLYPEYLVDFENLLSTKKVYSGNLMVMERQQYNEYCKWLFEILFDASESIDVSGYDLYHARVFRFLSEGLLQVWAMHHNWRVYEAHIGYTDEKAETKELKLAVAQLLRKHKYLDAEKMFNEVMTARPDLQLPMSDIRRDLPVIRQILYIGNKERELEMVGLFVESNNLSELLNIYKRHYENLQMLSQATTLDEITIARDNLLAHHFTSVALEVMLEYDMYKKYKCEPLNAEKLKYLEFV